MVVGVILFGPNKLCAVVLQLLGRQAHVGSLVVSGLVGEMILLQG
jgi:hypothetical protein